MQEYAKQKRAKQVYNIKVLAIVIMMIVAAVVYLWVIDSFVDGLQLVGPGTRFLMCVPGYTLMIMAVVIVYKHIK